MNLKKRISQMIQNLNYIKNLDDFQRMKYEAVIIAAMHEEFEYAYGGSVLEVSNAKSKFKVLAEKFFKN